MKGKMMLLLWTFLSLLCCKGNAQNADFSFQKPCYSVDDTLTLQAEYTGSGTPQSVQWSYSGAAGGNLIISADSCTIFGSVPTGFPPLSRINYTCPDTNGLPNNIFRFEVSNLEPNEMNTTWGATFTPPSGPTPASDKEVITECIETITSDDDKTWKIVGGVLGGVGGLCVCIAGGYFIWKWKNKTENNTQHEIPSNTKK